MRGRSLGSVALSAAILSFLAMTDPGTSTPAQAGSPGPSGLPGCGATTHAGTESSPAVTPMASVLASSPAAMRTTSELVVFGAASLRGAFEALAPGLHAATGIAPLYSFDASSALRAQIELGAPADVFASADTTNVATLLDAGLARDPVVFACNQLAIIVPAGNPAGITSAADLGRPGVRVVAAGDEVPITRYAMQVVANLGIADAYTTNIVSREDNVAAVRSRIELGEGDAAIVYRTDTVASGDLVAQIAVPSDANVPATYAAAVVSATDQPTEATDFLGWLTGPQGQEALADLGFLPAP